MVAGSTIYIAEEEIGKWRQYYNKDFGDKIDYQLYRGLMTGKFSKLKISVTYGDEYYPFDCICACIAIPEYDLEYFHELSMNKKNENWSLEWDFDLNLENEIPDDVNEVIIQIYTCLE